MCKRLSVPKSEIGNCLSVSRFYYGNKYMMTREVTIPPLGSDRVHFTDIVFMLK
jgi:hypothetical protein